MELKRRLASKKESSGQKRARRIAQEISCNVIQFWEQLSFTLFDRVLPTSAKRDSSSVSGDSEVTEEAVQLVEELDDVLECEKLALHQDIPLSTLKRWYTEPEVVELSLLEAARKRNEVIPHTIDFQTSYDLRGTKRKFVDSSDDESEVSSKAKRGRGRGKYRGAKRRRVTKAKGNVKEEEFWKDPLAPTIVQCHLTLEQKEFLNTLEKLPCEDKGANAWDKIRGFFLFLTVLRTD